MNIAAGDIIACSSATSPNKCFNKNACLKNTALFHAQGCNTGIDLQQQVKPSQAPSLHAENDPCRGINFDELVKHAKSPRQFPTNRIQLLSLEQLYTPQDSHGRLYAARYERKGIQQSGYVLRTNFGFKNTNLDSLQTSKEHGASDAHLRRNPTWFRHLDPHKSKTFLKDPEMSSTVTCRRTQAIPHGQNGPTESEH